MKDGLGPSSAHLTTMVREMGYLAICFQSGYELTLTRGPNAPASEATPDLAYVSGCSVESLPIDELRPIGAKGLSRLVVIVLVGHRFKTRALISPMTSSKGARLPSAGWKGLPCARSQLQPFCPLTNAILLP